MTNAIHSRPYPEQDLLDDGDMGGGLSSMLSLATIRGVVYRQRFTLVGIVSLALVAALVVTLLTRPMYSASATVRIDPFTTNIVDGQNLEPDVPVNEVDRYMQTQATVITSRDRKSVV